MKRNDQTAPLQNVKRFRLVSIYVGNFGCFQNQTFNFCSDYMMEREPDRDGKLCLKVTHKKVLPDNFFSLSGMGKSCVDSVSAIIGKNGTGKSTLARLLCNLPHDDSKAKNANDRWKVVVVYEIDETLCAYSTSRQSDVSIIGDAVLIKAVSDRTFLPPYHMVYFSPHYTTEQCDWNFNGGDVVDVSTTSLMRHPTGNSELLLRPLDADKKGEDSTSISQDQKSPTDSQTSKEESRDRDKGKSPFSVDVTHLSVFEGEEMIRVFEFLAKFKELCNDAKIKSSEFDMPMPAGVCITIRADGMNQGIRELSRYCSPIVPLSEVPFDDKKDVQDALQQYGQKRDAINHYLTPLIAPFEKSRNISNFVVVAFMAYVIRYLQEGGGLQSPNPERELSDGFLQKLRDFIVDPKWDWEHAYPSPDDIVGFYESNVPAVASLPKTSDILPEFQIAEAFFKLLRDIWNCSQRIDGKIKFSRIDLSLCCHLDDKEVMDQILLLIRYHSYVKVFSPFLAFTPIPRMSSGQMSFVSLFARLDQLGSKFNTHPRPVVIFLDEAETTLHPEWQRRLVSYLIRFLNVFMPGRRYQLIFASHSPTLLSDIPKGNCAFLRWTKKNDKYGLPINESVSFGGKEGVGGKEEGECDNTFGANIYDLYHNAFFLEYGAIGEFAEAKIQDALKAVKESATAEAVDGKKPQLDENIDKLMDLVGDRIVHRYFQRLKEFGLITGADLK